MSRRVSDDSNHRRNPIDLVKLFYEEKIDFKELLSQRQSSRKRTTTYSLDPYNVDLSNREKSHLLRRSLVGVSNRHLEDLEE